MVGLLVRSDGGRRRLTCSMGCVRFLIVILILLSMLGMGRTIGAQEPNVGLLRVAGVEYPRQVAPRTGFAITVDVEYAIHEKGTIKASLFQGTRRALGSKLWESEPVTLTGGGDRLWDLNLTAPPAEGNWTLTVIAFYLDAGKWAYYNDSYSGPGYIEITLKVAAVAELEVDLGAPNISVTVENSTHVTSVMGQVKLQLPIGRYYHLAVPPVVQFDNSTRLVFVGWQDGYNGSQRTVKFDGDSKSVGSYKTQYLLKVSSIIPGYSNSTWYDAGSNAALSVNSTVPMSWPLSLLGLSYVFKGWIGSAQSDSTNLSITMNGPRVVTANFAVDYAPLVVPAIILAGVAGGIAVSLARRRLGGPSGTLEEQVASQEPSSGACEYCGKPVDKGWVHCIHCGRSLNPTGPVQS